MLVRLTLVLAGAAVATLQYRTRNTRRTLGIVVPPLVLAIVALNAAGAAPGGRFAAGSSVPEDLRARDVRGHVMAARPDAFGAGRGAWSINVELTLADARAGYRYTLQPGVSLELQDGSSHPLFAGGNPVRLTLPRPPVPGVRWRDPELSGSHLGLTNLSVTIPGELMEAVRTGGTRLVFGGRMEVAEPHPVEALPLRSGATGHEGQRTFGVLSVEQVDGAPIIQMHMDGVGPDDGGLEWSIR
jgi:hypothetical protein